VRLRVVADLQVSKLRCPDAAQCVSQNSLFYCVGNFARTDGKTCPVDAKYCQVPRLAKIACKIPC
jgi:hypothetical protein